MSKSAATCILACFGVDCTHLVKPGHTGITSSRDIKELHTPLHYKATQEGQAGAGSSRLAGCVLHFCLPPRCGGHLHRLKLDQTQGCQKVAVRFTVRGHAAAPATRRAGLNGKLHAGSLLPRLEW